MLQDAKRNWRNNSEHIAKKILVVYKFATLGGVGRILLNRAHICKIHDIRYKLFVYFMEDCGGKGGKTAFKEYIINNEVEGFIEVIEDIKSIEPDYIVSIDTPEIFDIHDVKVDNIIFETHTYERRYRIYLDKYIEHVKYVVVPSESFRNILCEQHRGFEDKIKVLSNFVLPKDKNDKTITLPKWNQKILFYLGRMDTNKNVPEIVSAFNDYIRSNNNAILLLVGTLSDNKILEYIKKYNLRQNVIILPAIAFDKTDMFLNTMKKERAVGISASRGESFGLSVAEIISHEIPIILSDIDAHKMIINSDNNFMYKSGDTKKLAEKMADMLTDYEKYEAMIKDCKMNKYEENFLESFKNIYT